MKLISNPLSEQEVVDFQSNKFEYSIVAVDSSIQGLHFCKESLPSFSPNKPIQLQAFIE